MTLWQFSAHNNRRHITTAYRFARRILGRYDYRLLFRTIVLIVAASTYCAIVGGSILLLPTGFVALEIAAPIALFLWGAPDLQIDYSRFILFFIHVFIFSQISVPNFYAVPLAGVGWVNLRKIEVISLLGLTALAYATSKDVRSRAFSIIQASKLFNYCLLGFLATLIISVPFSRTPQVSAASLAQPFTTWYLVYFAVLAVKDIHQKIDGIVKSLLINIIILAIICVVERRLQRRIMFDIMPASLINSLLDNPSFALIYLSSGLRSGAFRAVASFTTPLSTGECAAMVLPFAYYFSFHKKGVGLKILGYVGVMSVAAVLLTSSARGAMLAAITTSLVYLCLALILLSKRDRTSLLPALAGMSAFCALPAVAFTDKVRFAVLGGGATAASNAGRSEQLRLALPKFIQSPLWGHGLGTGAEVVGFNPGNYFTLDSYVIAVAIEMGLPGLVCLLVMVLYPIIVAAKFLIVTDGSPQALLGVILALPLVAFATNMLVLTQIENHGLLFLTLGLFAAWRSYAKLASPLAFSDNVSSTETVFQKPVPNAPYGWATPSLKQRSHSNDAAS